MFNDARALKPCSTYLYPPLWYSSHVLYIAIYSAEQKLIISHMGEPNKAIFERKYV